MAPVHKFFLRNDPDRSVQDRILGVLKESGRGLATIEREGRFSVLYVEHVSDVELVKRMFADAIDAEADLTE